MDYRSVLVIRHPWSKYKTKKQEDVDQGIHGKTKEKTRNIV